ncbi:LysR family transcriptional regulator [Alcaligenaceae bacterium CGII-47]|nr:LysR family transcriptional regulator [Alcaligenaceae bacterium CGII-47]
MDLSSLADFHLVAGAGGFGRASRASGRPKATLSRRVRDLEESLGLRLIERGHRSLRMTDEGQVLYERTRGLLREIQEIGQELSSGGMRPHGLLRVSVPVLFASTRGGTIATEFSVRYPEVQIELIGEDRRVDLVEDGYDIAIRVNPRPDTELVGRCFARDEMWLVAPHSLALPKPDAHGGDCRVPAAMMIGLRDTGPWEINVAGRRLTLTPDYRLRVSSLLMLRDAVLACAGAAQLPRSLVRQAVETGQLALWGTSPAHKVELWALHRSRRLVSPKVAAFMAYLSEAFPTREL